jgi:cell wall-associated NlpC family hydrolase
MCSVMLPGTLTSMPMPNSLASVLRRAMIMLGFMVGAVVATPGIAEADLQQPRATRRPSATATAARQRQKPVATSRSRSSRSSSSTRSASRSSSRRVSASSRSGRRNTVVTRRNGRRVVVTRRSRRVAYLAPLVVPNVAQASFISDSADRLRDSVVSIARQQIGTPYVWGAETPGLAFDCSGLVKYVMSWVNVRLPRTAHEQSYTGIRVGRDLDRMKPGDLLTFGSARRITHIGFYAGNGRYVHASRPGVGVVESALNTRAARFRGAVRLIADADSVTTKTELTP